MQLSIIVPVYNDEAFLRRCLDSLLAQSVQDCELLFVDDGSTDASPQILEDYRARFPEKIRVLRVENGGQGRARNIGIAAAQGEYFGFADSDDWVAPDMYESLLSAAQTQGADLAMCDALACPEGGQEWLMPYSREGNELKSTVVWNKLIRRDLMEKVRFPEDRLWYEDLPVSVLLVLNAQKIARVPRTLYFYRIGQDTTMHNRNTRKNLDVLTVVEGMKDELLARDRRDVYESIVLNHILLDAIKRVAAQKTPERDECLAELRNYVKREIPHLAACPSFRQESRNRRIVMRLNYLGMHDLALRLLALKQERKGAAPSRESHEETEEIQPRAEQPAHTESKSAGLKLSVIVPIYKTEDFLSACVDSLLEQTLRDMEIILVDDGSPDRSGEIMKDYAARFPDRVRCLSLDNGGQGRARNRGIELARGEYLGFVDSDDVVRPEMFETLCRTADETGADVVDCCVEAFYPDGHTETLRTWRDGCPMAAVGSACNKLFRRDFVGETRFPEGLKYEDFAFSAELLLRAKKTVHLPEALYRYRVGQPSTMHNEDSRMNLDLLEIMEQLREGLDPQQSRDDFEFLLLNHVLLDAIKRVAAQKTPERDECLALLRGYVQREIPQLSACRSFREESRNRRIIMRLNYMGLHDVALKLLALKLLAVKQG